jgi:hypothetical protein
MAVRSGRAARRPITFEAEATPASAALIADAATIVSLAFQTMAARDKDRARLYRIGKVQFAEGRSASAMIANGVLQIIVAPSQGMAGRPSSDKLERLLRAAK